MTAGAMLTHLTKPFDTSGKSAARRHHRGARGRTTSMPGQADTKSWQVLSPVHVVCVPAGAPHRLRRRAADLGIEYFAVKCYVCFHGLDPEKVKTPHPATAHGVAAGAAAGTGAAAGAALGAGFARSEGARGDPP